MVRICGHDFDGWHRSPSDLETRPGVYVVGWNGWAVRWSSSSMLRVSPDSIKRVDVLQVGESVNVREAVERERWRWEGCWERFARLPDGELGTMLFAQYITTDHRLRRRIAQDIQDAERPPCGDEAQTSS